MYTLVNVRCRSPPVRHRASFRSIPLDESGETLLSEEMVHNLLHLISNTRLAI